jgi:hypothetical protein
MVTYRVDCRGRRYPSRYRSHITAEYVFLLEQGESFHQVAQRAGISPKSLSRTLVRNGHRHLVPVGAQS